MQCNYEQRLIAQIDLTRAVAMLDDRSFELLVLRNVIGLDWDAIEKVTGRNWRVCRKDLRQVLVALALWLRSYSSHAGKRRLPRPRLRAKRQLRSEH
jgi:hypothetical protein